MASILSRAQCLPSWTGQNNALISGLCNESCLTLNVLFYDIQVYCVGIWLGSLRKHNSFTQMVDTQLINGLNVYDFNIAIDLCHCGGAVIPSEWVLQFLHQMM